jgi:NAD+ synthase (glutamine-hydrolysing)
MKIGCAQINPTVGDIGGNAEIILDAVREADSRGVDLLLFPELALTGYPPEDLLFKNGFIKDNKKSLMEIAHLIQKFPIVLGFVDEINHKLFNAAAWIEKGRIKHIYHKQHLPNYGVFDERRYFEPGKKTVVSQWEKLRVGITICEDIWINPRELKPFKKSKPDILVNISASPFHTGKIAERHQVTRQCAKILQKPILYCNLVGGQDELVFDGGSYGTLPSGKLGGQCPQFQSGLYIWELDLKKKQIKSNPNTPPVTNTVEEIHGALILGIKDYVNKNKFKKVAVSVSGGIDSAVVAALATEALGPERVVTVTMPSSFNRPETVNDAVTLVNNLGTPLIQIPINDVNQAYLKALKSNFSEMKSGAAEENIQARIRGNLIMALSNKFGWLVLTTGNKSETSTGYCTLYGDMAGGFAVLKDVYKTTVYQLAQFMNQKAGKDIIPQSTIDRPPSAELKEDQKDEDTLGRYVDLDKVLEGYVEQNRSLKEIQKVTGLEEDYIEMVISLVDKNEYKRRQAPPGIKITPRSFGRDHRMPITNQYKPISIDN